MTLGQALGNDWQFYASLYIFGSCTFFYLSTLFKGWENSIMLFLCGVSFYNVFKPLFEDVTKDGILEYISFFSGLLFIFVQYAKTLINRHITRRNNQ